MKQKSLLCCMLALLGSLNVLAYDFESDGIYYTITGSNTVSVVRGDYAYTGNVTIPEAVGLSGKTYLVTGIGEDAFRWAAELDSVKLPEGLVFIDNYAFNQSSVKAVDLPSTMSSMGASAFSECKSLTSIVLPDALTAINESAFKDCTVLRILTLSKETISIGNNAFQNTAIQELSIPKTVKEIGERAFSGCKSLKTLVIDNAATYLGGFSFDGCEALQSVDLGNAITGLSVSAQYSGGSDSEYHYGPFVNCTSLSKIEIPASVTKLRATFRGCKKLKEVKLPATLVSIGDRTFENCAITDIDIPSSVTYIGGFAFSNCPLNTLNLTSVTTIGNSAFSNSPLKAISLPQTLETIGIQAFYNTSLSEIVIPQSVTSIGFKAFGNCYSLKSIKIEDAPVRIDRSFSGCSSLINVDLGNSVIDLGNGDGGYSGSFAYCTSLQEITIPSSIQTIGSESFLGCTALKNVKLSDGTITIGTSAFNNCINLTNIQLPSTLQGIGSYAFYNCRMLKSILLPSSLKTIRLAAFQYCTSLRDLVIPENVSILESSVFADCIGIESVIFDNTIVAIPYEAFIRCINLKSLDLGKVTSIGAVAFEGCGIEKLIIPNSVESINMSFNDCPYLKEVVIGTGLKSLLFTSGYSQYKGKGAFGNCTKLTKVDIRSQVLTTIGENTFYNCRSLRKIELPASVTSIGETCFSGCSEISHIYMNPATPPAINGNTFPDYTTPTLHVPSSAKTDYTRADNWKWFTNVVAIGEEPKATEAELAVLDSLLTVAQSLYDAAVEGSEPGNYRPGAKATLKAVITEVSARIVENMLAEDVEDCIELLNTAMKSFKNKQVKNDYQTDNTLIIASSLKASKGVLFSLPIEMNNVNEISAVQFDLYLPEGMVLSKDENDSYQIVLSERATDKHALSYRIMDDGAIRMMVSSSDNATITGNNGTLVTLELFPQNTMEAGDYNVALKNIVLTNPEAKRYASTDMNSVITVSAYTLGDVNNDTHIDVADLTGVVLFILENADDNLVFNAADMDGNGLVEVNDYAALVNVILAQNVPAESRSFGKNTKIHLSHIGLSDISLNENGEGELIVNLFNKDRSYSGLQFDLYLPEGVLLNVEGTEAVSRQHGIWIQQNATGFYRIICSSLMNAELNEGDLIRMQVKADGNMQGNYKVQANNVVLSDTNALRHEAANANAQLTIGDETSGIVSVEDIKQLKNVFDLQGRRVNATEKGVYVVNGKKVVVR